MKLAYAVIKEGPPVLVQAWDEDDLRGGQPGHSVLRSYASSEDFTAALRGGRLRRAVKAKRYFAAWRERNNYAIHPLEELCCMPGEAGMRAIIRLLGDDCEEWDR